MKQKFKIDDIVKYNGNIYQIVGLKMGKQNLLYDVKCLKNNFPDEPVSSSIGSCAEDKMELVDFTEPTEKQKWIEKACSWLLNNIRYYAANARGAEYLIEDFKKHMEEKTMTKEEFEEIFDELIQELELQPGECIDINYMLGEHQEIGVHCEVWQNE